MSAEVGLVTGVAGALATPLVLAASRWAPAVARPEVARARTRGRPDAPHWVHQVVVAGGCATTLGLIGARIGADAALAAYLVFGLVGVALALVDLGHHRLPDVLTLSSYPVGAALLGLATLAGSTSGHLVRALFGAVVGFAAYAVLYIAARSGIGAGDVKYAGVVGLHAAWLGWGSLVVALVGGFLVGGVVSLVLLARGRAGLKTRLPFGPAMVAGAVLGIVWGESLAAAWLAR